MSPGRECLWLQACVDICCLVAPSGGHYADARLRANACCFPFQIPYPWVAHLCRTLATKVTYVSPWAAEVGPPGVL